MSDDDKELQAIADSSFGEEEEEDNSNDKVEEIDDFDEEMLIIEGKDAIIERFIEYFNYKIKKVRKMRVYVKPLPYFEMRSIEKGIQKDKANKKDLIKSACMQSWVKDLDGTPMESEKIMKMGEGIPKAVWEEIKIVSGHTTDRTEDKLISKLAGF